MFDSPICGWPARKEKAHVGVDVRDRADRGTCIAADALLVDDDDGRQVADAVDVGPAVARQAVAHEGRERFVQLALGLCGDCVEHQR
jgi:hypothetical protein